MHRSIPPAAERALIPPPPGQELTRGNTEAYDAIEENPFVLALQQPQSTFSIDVDTASYANVRRFLQSLQTPPKGAVRLEELVNYFQYDYPQPSGEHPFSVIADRAPCPWKPQHQLVRVALMGKSVSEKTRPPCNLVFLVDVSGSMAAENKLPLVQWSLKLLARQMDERDRLAIVAYAGRAGTVLPPTRGNQTSQIQQAIDSLSAGGSTNGAGGIVTAYELAKAQLDTEASNRVILCTDGDFNVGISNESELVALIAKQAQSQVFLSVLGFGMGNYKDSILESLADHGNGIYAYIDSETEARKVFQQQIAGTLVTIAKDVKIQVDFNPMHVQSYRLLGYENRVMANEQFRDDHKDAGEIGAGHTVTAFYEIAPTSELDSKSSIRESEFVKPAVVGDADTLLTVNLRYKQPRGETANEFQLRLPANSTTEADDDFRFASAVLAYGMLLRGSEYKGNTSWDWVIDTAGSVKSDEQRAEFVELARRAKKLTSNGWNSRSDE